MAVGSVPSSDPYQYSNYNLMSSTSPMSVTSSQNGGEDPNESIQKAIAINDPDLQSQKIVS